MELRFELLQDPPHSIGLSPSDFYLFSNLERWLRQGQRCSSNEEVKWETDGYFRSLVKSYYKRGIELKGDYLREQLGFWSKKLLFLCHPADLLNFLIFTISIFFKKVIIIINDENTFTAELVIKQSSSLQKLNALRTGKTNRRAMGQKQFDFERNLRNKWENLKKGGKPYNFLLEMSKERVIEEELATIEIELIIPESIIIWWS